MKTENRPKTVLRRESFGGMIIVDGGRTGILSPAEYDIKKAELEEAMKRGENAVIFDARNFGYPLLANALSSPVKLYFELTKRCNGACSECFMNSTQARSDSRELGFHDVKKIITDFSKYGGLNIRITGGEPTIRDDFFDILDVAAGEALEISMNTN